MHREAHISVGVLGLERARVLKFSNYNMAYEKAR